jgi:plastocyanin
MKTSKMILMAVLTLGMSYASAQVEQIDLEQTTGEFTQKSLDLQVGEYQFNIFNNNVDHEVGFVLVPKGKYGAENHIKEAYVKTTVATGKSSLTSVVSLEAGEYEYFCPMNPTAKYVLTVHDDVETIKLGQVEGAFEVESVTVSEGSYQFNIANNGVDHEVGFVLVPKGKYGAEHHIKSAYVSAPVKDGGNASTGIVVLEAGEYEYFCPMNPTPKYSLTVVK